MACNFQVIEVRTVMQWTSHVPKLAQLIVCFSFQQKYIFVAALEDVDSDKHITVDSNTTADVRQHCSRGDKQEGDDKCLDLLNPLASDQEDHAPLSVDDNQSSQSSKTSDTITTTDKIIQAHATSARPIANMVQNQHELAVEDAVLPGDCSAQILPEPTVDSFYTTPPEDKKENNIMIPSYEQQLAPPTSCDELDTLKELEELRAFDLEDSQVSTVAPQDHTAASPPLRAQTE